jgi:hypothetical protein
MKMKKLNLLFTVLFIAAAMMSCNLADWNTLTDVDNDFDAVSRSAIYRGGNATCDQLGALGIEGLVKTTNRNNYNPATDEFETGWPSGLAVMVSNDKSVSFQIDGSINLGDGKCYKVGAVIVKGSDASNIYSYPNGTDHDINLLPPTNASGGPAGLSNLTFCFVECEQPELVIALKCYMTSDTYAVTSDAVSQNNTYKMGSFSYVFNTTNTFNIYLYGDLTNQVGVMTITNNATHLHVVIVASGSPLLLTKTFLYVGTGPVIPANYPSFPYIQPVGEGVLFSAPQSSVTYDIPLTDF